MRSSCTTSTVENSTIFSGPLILDDLSYCNKQYNVQQRNMRKKGFQHKVLLFIIKNMVNIACSYNKRFRFLNIVYGMTVIRSTINVNILYFILKIYYAFCLFTLLIRWYNKPKGYKNSIKTIFFSFRFH